MAATKTFLGQLLVSCRLAVAFAERRGGGAIGHDPEQLLFLVNDHDLRCEQLAHLCGDTQDGIFLGQRINYPIALEGALELK